MVHDPENYVSAAKSAVRHWTETWTQHPPLCFYERGPGYVNIFDTRPLDTDMPTTTRRTRLDGPLADIYLFCDEIRSRPRINEMLRRTYSRPIPKASLERVLEKLVTAGLVYREGEGYLSLATRKAHTVAPRPRHERKTEAALAANVRLGPLRDVNLPANVARSAAQYIPTEFARTE